MTIPVDWTTAGPAAIVALAALLALMLDAAISRRTWLGSGLPAGIGLLAAGAELLRTGGVDDVSFAFSAVVVVGALLMVLAANVMNHETSMPPGELHALLLMSTSGGLVMVAARDVVTLVVAVELLALPSVALVGLRRGDRRAISAAWGFFITSVVSTAVTLMGVALLYGVAGSLDYADLASGLAASDVPDPVVAVAVTLTLVGLLFKLGAVPFHVWVPDTYRGASVVVAGFLASVSKAAALGAVLTLLVLALGGEREAWTPVLAVVAAVTMTVGNLGALREREAVGMLAWSSVAQAGFLLAPATALVGTGLAQPGITAAVQYLAVYALANVVAFSAVAVVLRLRGSTAYGELAGLARSDPWMGVPLAFAVLVLAGFPPAVIGLVTKYVVLVPVVQDGPLWLAVVMAVNVMLGLAYYLRLVAVLLARPDGEPYVSPSPPFSVRVAKTVVLVGTGALVATSLWPALLLTHLP